MRSFADSPADRRPKEKSAICAASARNWTYLNDGQPGKGNDIEAGILWLMPIFPTHTYHGYDIEDYRAVNPEYGTMQDLKDAGESGARPWRTHHSGYRV